MHGSGTGKGMKQLTGKERRRLRGLAHGLKPLVHVGKNGVTEGVIDDTDRALRDHELIKIRFLDYKEHRQELSQTIAEATQSAVVDTIGNTLILYRESSDSKKRKIRR
jgi:RNA-binding protein